MAVPPPQYRLCGFAFSLTRRHNMSDASGANAMESTLWRRARWIRFLPRYAGNSFAGEMGLLKHRVTQRPERSFRKRNSSCGRDYHNVYLITDSVQNVTPEWTICIARECAEFRGFPAIMVLAARHSELGARNSLRNSRVIPAST
jgi:hypothetical protein